MHYFISCYWFDKIENDTRRTLKDDFVKRFQWVTLLERKDSVGFVDYHMINQFLKTINKETLESITLIDCDVILPYNFKDLVEESMKKYDVSHNCKIMYEMNDNQVLYSIDSISYYSGGHTGLSWSFSKTFLEAINYTFPESWLYGSLDYFFGNLFIRRKPEQFFKDQLGAAYDKMFKDFYEQTKDFVGTTLNCEIITFWHNNDRFKRIIPLKLYENLTDDKLKEIMKQRNSV